MEVPDMTTMTRLKKEFPHIKGSVINPTVFHT